MMFASKGPRNNDPFPRQSHTWPEPDPAWNITQHNAPNPVLIEFREVVYGLPRGRKDAYRHEVEWWLRCLAEPASLAPGYRWTFAQIEHARRVLTRLAALA